MLKNFTPFPVLKTRRLVLRQIEPNDASIVFELRVNETVNRFLLRPQPETIANVLEIIDKLNRGIAEEKHIYWVINLGKDRRVIGTICLWNFSEENSRADLGYELHPDFQKKGLMREAVEEVLRYGFEKMNLERIDAWTNAANAASVRLLERSGFLRNAEAEAQIDREKEGEDTVIYSLEKDVFNSDGR